jgi:uncharacterized circularly permuted ATP-grasp superfamily protein
MRTLNGYRSATYDDAVDAEGAVRPAAKAVMDAVQRAGPGTLGGRMRAEVDAMGIRFGSVDGDDSWHVDPVPRVIPAGEWAPLEAGLQQRVRALNAFVADVYGARRIVAEGVVPARLLESADHLEPSMQGVRPPRDVWIGIAGLDVVRDAHGTWMVLEDNVRTPSGLGYWPAARLATLRGLDLPEADLPRSIDGLGDALRRVFGPGEVVVLTDGPDNSAYWEHDWLAKHLGIALVTPADLEVRDGRVWRGSTAIDTVYRRTNADEVDSEVGRLLHPVVAAGGVRMVNCFGTGIADDKLAHAYVHDMIRFYLDEEPTLEQVETFDLGEPAVLERALDVFDELVIKDRGSYGGLGVVVCPHADRADIDALREQVRAAPGDYVAQRLVGLSTHPTEVHGELAPRHVDLRPYVLMTDPDLTEVLPGGLTRVALDEGALVVNSSQNGGAKDTWVVP